MLHQPVLHVEVARADSRFRSQIDARQEVPARQRADVVIHWAGRHDADRLGQPLDLALAELVGCLTPLEAVSTIDSALHRGLCSVAQIRRHLGRRGRAVLGRCDASAESGVESIFRMRARAAGFEFQTQAELPGSRVDFLFGDRLIVEVDGAEYHAGSDAFKRDRERDAWHAAMGYRPMRFTYDQVVRRWNEVESVLRLLLQRGEHLDLARARIGRATLTA